MLKMKITMIKKVIMTKKVIIGGLGLVTALKSFYNVEGGNRAVVFNRISGMKDEVYPEGTHLKIPFIERAIIYNIRARPYQIETTAGSYDLQKVDAGVRVLHRPVADQLLTIYRTLGKEYEEKVLPSLVHETLKSVFAQYNATQLLTQREMVSSKIRELLTERAASFNIIVDDVSITNLSFGKEFTASIEAKQIAEQEAQKAVYLVEKAEQDKKSAIVRAEGEAKSAELIGQAMAKNQSFLALRKIEAAREIAETISKSANKVYLNADNLLLDLQQMNLESQTIGRK